MIHPPRPAFALCCAAAALLLALAYANHFGNAFHFDDAHTIEQNAYLRELGNIPRFFLDPTTFSALPSNQSYRPVLSTTLALDFALSGTSPVAFHVDSFAWLCLQCLLMGLLFRRLLGDRWLALLGAALFGLHTAVAETVNYVIARGDILSTLGTVAALELFSRGGWARRYQLHLLPLALGVLAKEQGAMAAPILVLYVGLIEQRQTLAGLLHPRRLLAALRPALPAVLVCGALVGVSLWLAPEYGAGAPSRLQYAATQPYALLRYAALFVAPLGLSADTDWTAVASPADPRIYLGAAFVVGLLALAFLASRSERARPAAFGLLWFFLALLPTSSLFPLAEVVNDHRMYFPFVGLCLATACAAGLLLERLPRARPALFAAAVVLLIAHAAGVHRRNAIWRTEETLWRSVTESSPGNARGWMNYGVALMAQARYPEAERCLREALRRAPGYGYVHTNLGILLAATGRAVEAEAHFALGSALAPGVPSLRYHFARWLDSVGRSDEALAKLRLAISAASADPAPRALLQQILERRQAWGELASAARESLRVEPGSTPAREALARAEAALAAPAAPTPERHLERSLALYRAGDFQGSLHACEQALALRPDYAEAFNNRCAALNALRRHAEAELACEAALRILPSFELARRNLAFAVEHQR